LERLHRWIEEGSGARLEKGLLGLRDTERDPVTLDHETHRTFDHPLQGDITVPGIIDRASRGYPAASRMQKPRSLTFRRR